MKKPQTPKGEAAPAQSELSDPVEEQRRVGAKVLISAGFYGAHGLSVNKAYYYYRRRTHDRAIGGGYSWGAEWSSSWRKQRATC